MQVRRKICALLGHRYAEQTEILIFGHLMIARLCRRCPKVDWIGPVKRQPAEEPAP